MAFHEIGDSSFGIRGQQVLVNNEIVTDKCCYAIEGQLKVKVFII
jgi:hypothetical protein